MKKLMLCRLVVGTVCALGIVSVAEAEISAKLVEAQQETEGKRAQKQELDDLQRRFREGQEARRRRRMGLPSASAAESAQKPTAAPIADGRPPRIYSEAEQAEADEAAVADTEGEEAVENSTDRKLKEFIRRLNPNSLEVVRGWAEPWVKDSEVGTTYLSNLTGYEDKVEVLEPASLREEMKERINNMLNFYK